MNLREQLRAKIARADELKSLNRDFTDSELQEITRLPAEVKDLQERIKRNDDTAAVMDRLGLGSNGPDPDDPDADFEGFRPTGTKGYAAALARPGKLSDQLAARMIKASTAAGAKALLPAGEVASPVPLQSDTPVEQGRVASSLLDVLPVLQNPTARFRYLRQVTRTVAAAPVAAGALKPSSVIGVEPVDSDLMVVAHLSEPIDKYLLNDAPALSNFIAVELLYGLTRALEHQVLFGDGTAPNLDGLFTTTGVQSQAFIADTGGPTGSWLRTARAAITKLEAEGHAPAAFMVSAGDWERAETARVSTGALDLGNAPVDSAARRLWGVPAVVCQTASDGTAALLGEGAAALNTDTAGIEIRWSESMGDDFGRNRLRARCEGRFQMSVYRPRGVVVVDTAA